MTKGMYIKSGPSVSNHIIALCIKQTREVDMKATIISE